MEHDSRLYERSRYAPLHRRKRLPLPWLALGVFLGALFEGLMWIAFQHGYL